MQTVKNLSPGLDVFTQSELLIEFHRMLKFGFLEGITLFSTAYDTQLRKKKAEEQNHEVNNPQDSTWSGSAKVSGPRLVFELSPRSQMFIITIIIFIPKNQHPEQDRLARN